MTSRERVLAHLAGRPVDRLPLMPITMMFACVQIGARYRDYCTDYRVMVEGQIRTAEAFGFDYVNSMSDPAREAADCGAVVEYFDNQPVAIVEDQALLADKTRLASLKIPDPLGGGRMQYDLRRTMLFLDALTFGRPEIFIGNCSQRIDAKTGEITDQQTIGFIRQQLAAFATFIERHGGKR